MRLDMVFDDAAVRALVKLLRKGNLEAQSAFAVMMAHLAHEFAARMDVAVAPPVTATCSLQPLPCRRNNLHPDTDIVTNGLGRFD
jgi:hypothetical protein